MNKYYLYILLLLMFFVQYTNGQDTIFFKSNERVLAIINEITETEIRYKEYAYPDGPDYIMSVRSITKIVYKNGTLKEFENDKMDIPFKRNIIAFQIFDLIYNNFTIYYEHILNEGKFGIIVPLSKGILSTPSEQQEFTSIFYSGIGLNIYFFDQQKFSYFMGPEAHFGVGMERFLSRGPNGNKIYIDKEFPYFRILVNNGLAYTFKSNLRLTAVFVFGVQNYNLYNSTNDGIIPIFYFTGSIGYRF